MKNAKRIRAKRVKKVKPMYQERATAYVIGDSVNVDTGEIVQPDIRVRVRDSSSFGMTTLTSVRHYTVRN